MANYNTNYNNIHLKIIQHIKGLKNLEFQVGTTLARNIRTEAHKVLGQSKYPTEYHGSLTSDRVVSFQENQHAVVIAYPAKIVATLEYGLDRDLPIEAKNGEYLHFIGSDGREYYKKEVTIPKSSRKPMNFIRAAIDETKKDLKKIYKDSVNIVR